MLRTKINSLITQFAWFLRGIADRLHPEGTPKWADLSFSYQESVGRVIHDNGNTGCPLWHMEGDYHLAHRITPPGYYPTSIAQLEHTRTWYRSIHYSGKVWCESSDPDEVIRMSADTPCTFQKLNIYRAEGGWEPWK